MDWVNISQWVYVFIITMLLSAQCITIKTNHSRIELSKRQHAELMQELKNRPNTLDRSRKIPLTDIGRTGVWYRYARP